MNDLAKCSECGRTFYRPTGLIDGICLPCRDPLKRVNDIILKAPEGPHGWIQWKGTNVCMDVHCPKCLKKFHDFWHIDEEFVYFIKCACGTIYAVNGHVQLVELNEAEAATFDVNRASVVHINPEEQQ